MLVLQEENLHRKPPRKLILLFASSSGQKKFLYGRYLRPISLSG
jgi:hypothetical protein